MVKIQKHLPALIYGTAWKKEKTAELIEKAILYGFRGIDTACQPKHYHEAGVGQALIRLKAHGILRESLYIQTKFTPLAGQDLASVPYDPHAPLKDQVYQSFQASLKNLGVTYVEALLLHSPLARHEETMEVWQAMEKLQMEGSVYQLGISNCYELPAFKSFYSEAHIKPSILQNRFYAQNDYDKILRSFCIQENIYYQSFWTLTANQNLLKTAILSNLALKKNISVEQIFFRYLTELNIIPLIGTCSERHMKKDLAIFDIHLTTDEMEQINTIFNHV